MKKEYTKYSLWQRFSALAMTAVIMIGMLPYSNTVAVSGSAEITTVADPETLTRPETIYGDNTVNAGKITVGKSVSDTDITINGQNIAIDGDNNFLVTISQSAQVMGLTSEINVPLDVVIVFDTSGSMGNDSNGNGKNRTQELVEAANKMIASLMDMNDLNRVGVVAFSAHNAGGGTAGYNAANVLSELAHYDGEAAANHLTWTTGEGPSWAPTVQLVQGRSTTNGKANSRYGTGGATNIQAGVTLGAQLLMEADTTVEVGGQELTRTPILVLMSDGAPTVSAYENQWWNASQTNNQGPTNAPFMGNGFLTVLTASYYKNAITEHYYGVNAGENSCSIYTVGVELSDAATQDTLEEVELSYMTLNPSGEFVAGSDNYYYDRNSAADSFLDAWTSYQNNKEFAVRVWSDQTRHDGYYYFYNTTHTIQNANDYKNGQDTWSNVGRVTVQANILDSITTLHYNDKFYDVTNVSLLTDALDDLLTEIARKAITVPTRVTTGDHDFDGYVTFTDPIGEYMEVKDMKGILADGYLYQGASFARNLANYGTANADPEFDALLLKVVQARMNLTDSVVDIDDFVRRLKASKNQAYYNGPDDYDNSIVWWGNSYDSGEEDEQVQVVGFADNDSIEYIESQRSAGTIPEGADYVCRSYFFYGEAGGANPNPDHEYMYFMVRVQRELTAPYRQSVVISAPASLLSMEKVLITETFDDDGDPIYTASVEHQESARVVYEVGLWDSITPETVSGIVSKEYAAETVNGSGSVNYDPAADTYYFFTNDWDRSQAMESHHRGMAKATFDAAADNAFYTYQEDTLVVDAGGDAVSSDPAGTTAYYVREYYEWPADKKQDGTYTATKKAKLIQVEIPADAELIEKNGKWYIPAGAYTAATLVVNGDDTEKSSNATGTSAIVAHPHRTGDSGNSHYTVLLGNNGMLSLKADTYEPVKTVSVNLPASAADIVDDEGRAVKVGDVLTYTVEVKNTLTQAADITVTDYVPLGTAFIEGSAGFGTDDTGHTKDASVKPDSNNVLTWVLEDVPAGETHYLSFQVTVTEAALSLSTVPGTIDNTAQVRLENGAAVSTNTTHNPPFGKSVTDVNSLDIDGEHGFKVGDVLVYHIRFHNNAMDDDGSFVSADAIVTDKIPEGTTFLSADNGGSYNAAAGIVTWTFENMEADTAKVVSFRVKINASAKAEEAPDAQTDGIEPASGEIYLPNTATIVVGNDPQVSLITNTTENWVDVGDMVLTKLVAAGGDQTKTFTIHLTESTGLLEGKYPLTGADASYAEFVGGKAAVSIKHGQTLTVKGLPAGVIITVEEDVSALPGWTPTYNTQSVTIVKGAATTVSSVSVTNTYTLEPLTVTVKGVKRMEGVLPNQATFGFVAEPDSSNPVTGDPLTGEVAVKAPGEYAFTLSPKTFTQPGVYKYTISEINGGLLGVTYDTASYVLVITVTDNGDGTMSATAALDGSVFDLDNDAVSFDNTYVPEDTQLVLTADKALSGRTLIPGEFNFRITDGTNVYKGVNDANGSIVFEAISYTAAGTYTYTLSEVVPTPKAEGITYDTKTHTIVVMVADVNGQLFPSVTVNGTSKTVAEGLADTGITFSNSFEPDDAPLTLVAKKTLKAYDPTSGSYEDAAPKAGKFRFQVLEKDTGNVVTTGTNAADGTITFNTFYFSADMLADTAADADGTKTKTFTYVISEVVPELAKDPNMLYDLDGREIQVTLTYAADGILTVTVQGDSDGTVDLTGSADFVNYGNPGAVEIRPVGTKTTENAPDGVSFSFSVIDTDNGSEAAAGVGDANGSIAFSALSFDRPGTYTYWIKESNAGNTTNGITYDDTRYLMKVVVSRDSYNRLVADVSYWSSNVDGSENVDDYTVSATAPSFHNKYEAGGYINLTAAKKLEGRSLNAGEFAFKLIRQDNGGEIDGIVAANGIITFSTMYYSEDDIPDDQTTNVIHYVMSEVIPTTAALPGVTYDAKTYNVYVRITDNNDGTISAELVEPDGSGGYTAISGTDTGVTFINTYTPVHGDEIKFRVKKTLKGRDLRLGEFDFLLQRDGSVVDIAANDENGIVTFTREIPATAAPGTYELTVREAPGTLTGVTYDTASYKIYVKITDDGKGNIEAALVDASGSPLAENGGVVDLTGEIEFVNTYEPNDTHYTPEAAKSLTGRDMVAGEFSFQAQLISRDGTAVSNGAVYVGVNAADGKVVFETIPYAEAGIYIYQVSEVPGSLNGVKYDNTVYYLKVLVEDDGNGYLEAAAGYYSDAACQNAVTAATFQNTYTPADVPVRLEAAKELTGRELKDKEFSFVVRQNDMSGKIIATGSNDPSGRILFSTFHITPDDMAGAMRKTFTYVVAESDNNIPGITVDETVFTVTVTVTDDGTGALQAAISYPDGQPIVFQNTYTPAPTELPLVAYKTLTGKNLAEGEFTFQLKDSAGDVVQAVANDANGVVTFEDLKLDKAGIYVYTLTERSGSMPGMAYDTNVYTITVTVTDDLNGKLVATAAYTDTEGTVQLIRFNNSYAPPAIDLELEGTKSIVDINGEPLNHDLSGFEFEVRDTEGNAVTTAVSDDQGNIKFTGFRLTAAGEYRFLISEKTTTKPGYTTDPTVWCVHVTVGYDADAGLLYEAGEYVHLAPETHDEVVAQAGEALSFVNVYEPADVSLTLKALKELKGRDLRDNEFTFYMVDKATGLRAAVGRNNAGGEISFHLTYTEAGTYSYTFCEEIPEADKKLGGVTYTTETYTVTVIVIDDGTGALKAQVGGAAAVGNGTVDLTGSVVFHNTYTPQPVDVTIEALKRLEGKDLTAGIFTFELVNAADPTDKRTASNAADGRITFEKLTFTEAGVYEYTLTETVGTAGGVTYDATSYTVTIDVADDGNGELHAAVHYARNDEGTEAVPVFHNSYKADKVGVQVAADKELVNKDMVGGEFTFQLKDSEGNILQAANDAEGNVVFDTIEYTEVGIYEYTLYEVKGEIKGITYDETVYTVTVTVTDDGEGSLNAEVVYAKDTDQVGKPAFHNSYKETSVAAEVEAKKVLTGKKLTEGQFTFELVNADDTADKHTAVNAADGTIVFDELLFNEAGVYTYKLSEVKGSDENVTYDETVYTVTITVTEDPDGQLAAAVDYNGGTPVFNNEYTETDTPATGDDAPVFVHISLMAFSVLALAVMLLLRRKEERKTV